MPIPYRDQDQLEDLGTAAFLRIEPAAARQGMRGAIFQINARGEPIEFTYSRVDTPNTFLWRPADIRRAAVRRLTASLLAGCSHIPRLIVCRASEVPIETFTEDLSVEVPLCRVAETLADVRPDDVQPETAGIDQPAYLFWYPAALAEHTPERLLIRELALHRLLIEPFDRAATGLAEVYGAQDAG